MCSLRLWYIFASYQLGLFFVCSSSVLRLPPRPAGAPAAGETVPMPHNQNVAKKLRSETILQRYEIPRTFASGGEKKCGEGRNLFCRVGNNLYFCSRLRETKVIINCKKSIAIKSLHLNSPNLRRRTEHIVLSLDVLCHALWHAPRRERCFLISVPSKVFGDT